MAMSVTNVFLFGLSPYYQTVSPLNLSVTKFMIKYTTGKNMWSNRHLQHCTLVILFPGINTFGTTGTFHHSTIWYQLCFGWNWNFFTAYYIQIAWNGIFL